MWDARGMPVGRVTRGTTGTNRLRRVDRWLAAHPVLRGTRAPLVVDLGFGASGTTAFELAQRLSRAAPGVRVHGLEIDPERVRLAREQLAARGDEGLAQRVSFAVGGFEVPTPAQEPPRIIRAFNVLRQYEQEEVADAWARLRSRLAPGGLLVEGTCNEVGRVASWFGIGTGGPVSFTIALQLQSLHSPLIVAERLPKALIHRNVPGEPVHAYLRALDEAWTRTAHLAPFGPRQRFIAAATALRGDGWPLLDGPTRWRLGELSVRAATVLPI